MSVLQIFDQTRHIKIHVQVTNLKVVEHINSVSFQYNINSIIIQKKKIFTVPLRSNFIAECRIKFLFDITFFQFHEIKVVCFTFKLYLIKKGKY